MESHLLKKTQGPQRRLGNSCGSLLQRLPRDTCKGLRGCRNNRRIALWGTLELCSPGHTVSAFSIRLCKTQSPVSGTAPAMLLEAPHHEMSLWSHHSTPNVLPPLPSHVTWDYILQNPNLFCSEGLCLSLAYKGNRPRLFSRESTSQLHDNESPGQVCQFLSHHHTGTERSLWAIKGKQKSLT